MSIVKAVQAALLAFLISGAAIGPATTASAESSGNSIDYKQLSLFRQVMGIVEKNYVKEVSDQELIQGAINGMLQALDPYSSYMTPELFKELQVETKGEIAGLGIEMTLDNRILTIVAPIEDAPADKAGLKPGDKIIKINGESTKSITLVKAVQQMRGPKGTKVTITIMREGFKKFKDYTVVRDIIPVHSVKKQLLEPGYPYIKIANFQESTDSDVSGAIDSFAGDEGIKGMVLDLRNNPGMSDPGRLLDHAVKVANFFVEKGLIVYTDGRVKDQRMEFRATSNGKHYLFRLACLINGGSASASEIVAGALQDHDRAAIFGSKSFGMASVQTIIPLVSGARVSLTTAQCYTPKGRQIQKTGILPDVDLKAEVQKEEELEEEAGVDKDTKQKKSYHKKKGIDPATDVVLRKALEWLKSDVTVKDFKLEQQQKQPKAAPDTALLDD